MAAFLIGVVLVVSGYILLWGMEWLEDIYLIRRESRFQSRPPTEDERSGPPAGDTGAEAGSEFAGNDKSKVIDG